MYAGAHTEFLKSPGRPIGEMAQISIRDLLVHEIEGGIIRPFGGRSLQNVVERYRRQFGVPTDTTRVRLDPGCNRHERHSHQSLRRLMEDHRSPNCADPNSCTNADTRQVTRRRPARSSLSDRSMIVAIDRVDKNCLPVGRYCGAKASFAAVVAFDQVQAYRSCNRWGDPWYDSARCCSY